MLAPARAWLPGFLDSSPAFAPLRAAGAPLSAFGDFPDVSDYGRLFAPEGLVAGDGAPARFVLQREGGQRRAPTTLSELYDGRIFERGEIPTRARSFHDLFNALVWASFPAAKRALNARQYRALAARLPARFTALPGARTREQDALAMLDEGGILLVSGEADARDVRAAHVAGDGDALEALVRAGRLSALVFGHALYEHLVSSPVPVRGRGVVLVSAALPRGDAALRPSADRLLAELLAESDGFPETTSAPAVPLALATGGG